ncbi:MAG TPA: HIT family protein [Burkholderiales bacterium]
MSYDPQNPFAKILRGELPCVKVYEDAQTLCIMDIMPQADGHALVLTKEPAATLLELSPEGAAACIQTAQRIARAIQKGLDAPGVLVSQFNGAAAGQTVPHVHFHVIPRWPDRPLRMHARHTERPEVLREVAQKIVAALDS